MQKTRVILVTGANKGIGLCLIKKLCQSKHKLVMAFRQGNNGIHEYQKLKSQFPHCSLQYIILDITKEADRKKAAQCIKTKFERIDILVNNAAAGYDEPDNIPSQQLATNYLNCNVISTIQFTQQLMPYLSDDGKIINVSSRVGALQIHTEEKQNILRNKDITKQNLYSLVQEYIQGCRQKNLNGWCKSAYSTSKSFLNAWNRYILQKQLKFNQSAIALSPGFCLTDMVKISELNSKKQKPIPKSPQQGIQVILYCMWKLPFSKQISGKFYYKDYQWNYDKMS